jgi:excisionase family DNA binding protein
MKELLRPDEVARLLKISKKKVYELINDIERPLPSKKIGGQLRVPQEGLKKYLRACENKVYQ